MAYIEERDHPDGSKTYRVRLRIKGMPDKSATFSKKTQPKVWGQKMEAEIRNGRYFSRQEDKERTFAEFIDKYIENIALKIKRPKEQKPREKYLEGENISRFLTECRKSKSPHLYAVVYFPISTGARKGEILSLLDLLPILFPYLSLLRFALFA